MTDANTALALALAASYRQLASMVRQHDAEHADALVYLADHIDGGLDNEDLVALVLGTLSPATALERIVDELDDVDEVAHLVDAMRQLR